MFTIKTPSLVIITSDVGKRGRVSANIPPPSQIFERIQSTPQRGNNMISTSTRHRRFQPIIPAPPKIPITQPPANPSRIVFAFDDQSGKVLHIGFRDARDTTTAQLQWKNVYPQQHKNLVVRVAAVMSILCHEVVDVYGVRLSLRSDISSKVCELLLLGVDLGTAASLLYRLDRMYGSCNDTREFIQRGSRELQRWFQRMGGTMCQGDGHVNSALYALLKGTTVVMQLQKKGTAKRTPREPPRKRRAGETLTESVTMAVDRSRKRIPLSATANIQTAIADPVQGKNSVALHPHKSTSLCVFQPQPANSATTSIPNPTTMPASTDQPLQPISSTDATGSSLPPSARLTNS